MPVTANCSVIIGTPLLHELLQGGDQLVNDGVVSLPDAIGHAVSLLAFFQAYSRYERIAVGVIGTVYIILANAIRITVIGVIIYYKGMSAYYMAHTFVGRIVFYGLSIMLYFIVFTKAQIVRQKVGGFSYGTNK